jgi:hypothetical protein
MRDAKLQIKKREAVQRKSNATLKSLRSTPDRCVHVFCGFFFLLKIELFLKF